MDNLYITQDLIEKSGKKSIYNAYQNNTIEVIAIDNAAFYIRFCPTTYYNNRLASTIKKQMAIFFPKLKYIE